MEKKFGKWSYAVAIVIGLFVGAFVGLLAGNSLTGVLTGVLSAAAATWLGAIEWSKLIAPIKAKIASMKIPRISLNPIGRVLIGIGGCVFWLVKAILHLALSPIRYIYRIVTNKEVRTLFYVSLLYPMIFAAVIGGIWFSYTFCSLEESNNVFVGIFVGILMLIMTILVLEDGRGLSLLYKNFVAALASEKHMGEWFVYGNEDCEPLKMALHSKHPPLKAVSLMMWSSLGNVLRLYWFIIKLVFMAPVKLFTYKTGASIITATVLSAIHLGASYSFGWIESGSVNYALLLCVCMIAGGIAGRKIHDLKPFTVTMPTYNYVPYEAK